VSLLIYTYGILTALCVVAGLVFLRYWRQSRDSFFIWFACAFWTFAVNWGLLAHDGGASEHSQYIYAVRLVGFLQIIAAILLKNRVAAS
jgi:hypothetical protein